MRKYLVFGLIALVATAAALLWFVRSRPVTVTVAVVERDVPVQVFGLGTVEARVLSSIGFEVGAALVELNADHGSVVKTGDVLAKLHTAEQESRVTRAKAGIAAAEAVVVRAKAATAKQAAILDQKRDANRRQQELAEKKVISVERAEESLRDLKVAESDLALALADEAVANAALESARADLAHEAMLLEHHFLRAPFAGLVVERHSELGAVVRAGDRVFTLANPASVWLLAHVEEARAGGLALGQKAEVRLRSLPAKLFKGRVTRIGIESDRVSEERRVYVTCEDCPADFHLGEQAEVVITTGLLSEALLVPETAIMGFDGHSGKLWIDDNGLARQVAVTFGARTLDGRVEVAGGLPPGAAVIVAPVEGLNEGRAVKRAAEATP